MEDKENSKSETRSDCAGDVGGECCNTLFYLVLKIVKSKPLRYLEERVFLLSLNDLCYLPLY